MKSRGTLSRPMRKIPHYFQEVSGYNIADSKQARSLLALMDMQAVLEGAASHFGGPSALVEIVSALWSLIFRKTEEQGKPWHERYHVVNDIGHAENIFYVLKAMYGMGLDLADLKGFRSLDSPLTGHGEALEFPENILVSNGPLGSALGPAQGLAMGESFSLQPRTTIGFVSDGACMEGEAKEVLASLPGLSARGKVAPFVLVVSDNKKKLSGKTEESFSMQPTFKSLSSLGWQVLELKKAHDISDCLMTLDKALNLAEQGEKPVAIWAHTIKGKGIHKLEQSNSGGHGFPLSRPEDLRVFLEELLGTTLEDNCKFLKKWHDSFLESSKPAMSFATKTLPRKKIQVGVSQALIDKKNKGAPLFSLSSDLAGSTGVAGFQKEFPKFSQDMGVAESNMISAATGFYLSGYIPIVDSFAQFAITKGILPLTMALQSRAAVLGIFSHVGFQDAADGASHQALNYLSNVASLPYTQVHLLSCADEAYHLVSQAVDELHRSLQKKTMPCHQLFFLGREQFFKKPDWLGSSYLGKAQVIRVSKSPQALLIVAGSLVEQGMEAAQALASQNIEVEVILHPCATQVDVSVLKSSLKKTTASRVFILEDHQSQGGLGERILSKLSQSGCSVLGHILGVQGVFGRSAYQASQLYDQHGLSSEKVAQTIKSTVESK